MTHRRTHKKNLSKGILEMKFMKKTKDKIERDDEEKDGIKLFSTEITKGLKSDGSQFIVEHSMVPIERLLCGRMSFKGMNPEIERLMALERQEFAAKEKALERMKSNQPEISDEKMARRLGKTVAKKFNTNNGDSDTDDSEEDESDNSDVSPHKKPKFMKPVDD